MLKAGWIIGLWFALTGYAFFAVKETPEKAIQQTLIRQTDDFSKAISQLNTEALKNPANEKRLQQLFLNTRLAYKKMEWATEYFAPNITRLVNGPPTVEAEAEGQVINPDGLQVIEGLLFPNYQSAKRKELATQLRQLTVSTEKYRAYFESAELYNWQIIDAAKQQIFRVETLGVTGFDDPLSLNCMAESAGSLSSLQNVVSNYTPAIQANFSAAIGYLQQGTAFNAFNRAVFITRYADPLSISLTRFQQNGKFAVVKYNRLLNQDAATLFEKDAFNSNAFIDEPEYAATPEKIALGKKLFSDAILSGAPGRSCASCHNPEMAFTDGLAKSIDVSGKGTVSRNAPTLINAALQAGQFYDLRAGTLEDQAMAVISSKAEMHGDIRISTTKLWDNQTYRALFIRAFPQKDRSAIDTMEVVNALASYIRSLTALNSRFDQYMQGKADAVNASEIKGFNLFMGKARCGTCHYMPLFNGTPPPKFNQIDAEVIGVPRFKNGKTIDPDMGRYAIVPIDAYKHAFKTTSVRNAARTAPYMHNGVFTTLDEVLDFYNKGGGAGQGIRLKNQTLSADQLHLTAKEKKDIIAFIKSLDSY